MSATIDETDFDLRTALETLGYSASTLPEVEASQVLLLPQDIYASESTFRNTSISLKKEIEAKMVITVLSKQGQKSHYFAERAADIVTPILVFLSLQSFDIGKAILASWVYDQMQKLRRGSQVPSAKLTVLVVDEKERVKKRVTYDGPADKIPEIIRETKLSK